MADPILNECINPVCPFSGKPVEADSLTYYRGHTVGFCNPGCRDKFAADHDAYPDAKALFDERIKDAREESDNGNDNGNDGDEGENEE